MKEFDLIIKNGTVVTSTESFLCDVAVKDGKIAAMAQNIEADAKEIYDAAGKLVLPGALDAHTHMAMPFGGTVSADSYMAGTRAAACGGVTTIFDYPVQHKGETIRGLVNSKKEVLEKEACVDYAMHCCITDLNEGEILEEMEKDYVIGARARGVSETKILFGHILPNAVLPLITILGVLIGWLLGGVAVVEMVFSWPGLGNMAIYAITMRDYPLIEGFVLWVALAYMCINALVDASYILLDPRLKRERA